ncbi:hypothetical protein T310_6443 [Rasamsonia emersonii CBS 393.64]|uniref:DUF3533 domain-containing protein n=1 Tax=Rasamsonia emersonii (strain ATCC 16479 / CBS 393.64 / IMI 116815) TaxID=1408163 RepID=A0A0F4YP00_RASE3|nr:hypothetical protein T310_6443 [Rasamsonia emersonii CBS 393.64]KKA19586.1 hypothetical protein T310_6443 [Rasamsonia emersonii CBS 393.64]
MPSINKSWCNTTIGERINRGESDTSSLLDKWSLGTHVKVPGNSDTLNSRPGRCLGTVAQSHGRTTQHFCRITAATTSYQSFDPSPEQDYGVLYHSRICPPISTFQAATSVQHVCSEFLLSIPELHRLLLMKNNKENKLREKKKEKQKGKDNSLAGSRTPGGRVLQADWMKDGYVTATPLGTVCCVGRTHVCDFPRARRTLSPDSGFGLGNTSPRETASIAIVPVKPAPSPSQLTLEPSRLRDIVEKPSRSHVVPVTVRVERGRRRDGPCQWQGVHRSPEHGAAAMGVDRPSSVLGLAVFILSVLSLYWGVLFGVEQNLPSLTTWIVDFDGKVAPYNTTTPVVGPFITNAFANMHPSTYDRLGWTIRSAEEFDNDPWAVRQGVYDEHAYVAIIINPNATALLRAAVNEGDLQHGSGPEYDGELHPAGAAGHAHPGGQWVRIALGAAPERERVQPGYLPGAAGGESGHRVHVARPASVCACGGDAVGDDRTDLSDHHLVLQLPVPDARPRAVCPGQGPPAAASDAPDRLAHGVEHRRVFLPVAVLLVRLARVPDSVLQPAGAGHDGGDKPERLREGLVCRVLDAELGGDGGAGAAEREHGDDPGTAVQRDVADLLGHYERVDGVLLAGSGAGVLCVGICVAAASDCRSVAHDPVRHALADRPRLWDFVRVGGGVDGAVSVCMLVHEMEDDEGEVASYSWLR